MNNYTLWQARRLRNCLKRIQSFLLWYPPPPSPLRLFLYPRLCPAVVSYLYTSLTTHLVPHGLSKTSCSMAFEPPDCHHWEYLQVLIHFLSLHLSLAPVHHHLTRSIYPLWYLLADPTDGPEASSSRFWVWGGHARSLATPHDRPLLRPLQSQRARHPVWYPLTSYHPLSYPILLSPLLFMIYFIIYYYISSFLHYCSWLHNIQRCHTCRCPRTALTWWCSASPSWAPTSKSTLLRPIAFSSWGRYHHLLRLPSPALPCPALPCPALPCPALPCPALPCPALPSPALPCPPLPSPALPCPPLPSPGLRWPHGCHCHCHLMLCLEGCCWLPRSSPASRASTTSSSSCKRLASYMTNRYATVKEREGGEKRGRREGEGRREREGEVDRGWGRHMLY